MVEEFGAIQSFVVGPGAEDEIEEGEIGNTRNTGSEMQVVCGE